MKGHVEAMTIYHYVPHPDDVGKALKEADPEISDRVKFADVKLITMTVLDLAHRLALADLMKRNRERRTEVWDQAIQEVVDHFALAK